MLKIENLNVKYGKIQVIWDLSMSIGNNEAVGIFGPNGAGKTTLINTVIGFLKPESGKIIFEDNSLIGLKTHENSKTGHFCGTTRKRTLPIHDGRREV